MQADCRGAHGLRRIAWVMTCSPEMVMKALAALPDGEAS